MADVGQLMESELWLITHRGNATVAVFREVWRNSPGSTAVPYGPDAVFRAYPSRTDWGTWQVIPETYGTEERLKRGLKPTKKRQRKAGAWDRKAWT